MISETLHRAATANFWQARPSQGRPHQYCATTAAAAFYSAKSRQGLGLWGLASHGGPEYNIGLIQKYTIYLPTQIVVAFGTSEKYFSD